MLVGKKCLVICSHLNPGSVMHMHAKELEDLRSLVTSRVKDAHVHICVDAQTGLGTGIPVTGSRNIGTATTVTHRAEKQRLLECFIMEYLLTGTNTFSNDDDRNANILTCNCNGCHEPQQIDHILSSDPSLRSRTFDSSATASDHWGLTATINSKRKKTLVKRRARKPIGWECRVHICFNNTVRAQVNVGIGHFVQEPRLSENASFALYISQMDQPVTYREGENVLDGASQL